MGFFRLYLAFLVFFVHLCVVAYFEELGNATFKPTEHYLGYFAVTIFFFISGYFMPLAFNHNYRHKIFSLRVRTFFINRFLRIFPLYWISIIIFPILYGFLTNKSPHFNLALQQPLIFLQNFLLIGVKMTTLWGESVVFNSVAWTLDLEWQYYLLLPFLAWHFKIRPFFFHIDFIYFFRGFNSRD